MIRLHVRAWHLVLRISEECAPGFRNGTGWQSLPLGLLGAQCVEHQAKQLAVGIDSCSMQPWKPNVRVVQGLPYQARRSVLGDYPKVACGWVALLHWPRKPDNVDLWPARPFRMCSSRQFLHDVAWPNRVTRASPMIESAFCCCII